MAAPGREVDVVIVGGGPAGLSAALVLGRARRRVILFDHGRYRNAASRRMHGYLSRDGFPPAALLEVGRREALAYGVSIRRDEVTRIVPVGTRGGNTAFQVSLRRGRPVSAKKVLLATGVIDRIPAIPGLESFYGTSVHHCPYCDGWEWRDRRLACYGRGVSGAALAHALLTWSRDVVLLTDGASRLTPAELAELRARNVEVIRNRVTGLEGSGGRLRRVLLRGRAPLERDALFFSAGNEQSCDLAVQLGCRLTLKAAIRTNRRERTNVPGVYVAGDASWDVQFVVVAAAEGAKAAVAINRELQAEERAVECRGMRVAPHRMSRFGNDVRKH
ncbi:MAG TPA: NAD(P)/FAD-dependent oxidoreductase [Candidatus Binatia bacterium]|nr:NAD(P)/FAD-dependent oxidoreductase [Candidatus Binatia bacterium]